MASRLKIDPEALIGYSDGDVVTAFTDSAGVAWEVVSGTLTYKTDADGVAYLLFNNTHLRTVSNVDFSATDKITIFAGVQRITNPGTNNAPVWVHGDPDTQNAFYGLLQTSGVLKIGHGMYNEWTTVSALTSKRLITSQEDKALSSPELDVRIDKAPNGAISFVGNTTGNFLNAKVSIGGGYNGLFTNIALYYFEVQDTYLNTTDRNAREDAIYDQMHPTPPDATPPSDASGVSASAIARNTNRIVWTNGADAESSVAGAKIERHTNSSFTALSATFNPAGTGETYDDTTAADGVQYWYRVKTKNGAGLFSDNWANSASVTTWNAPPAFTTAASLGNVNINEATDFNIGTTGGNGTRTIAVQTGESLPSGVSLAGNVLTINKSTIGSISIPLKVSDANNQIGTRTFTATLVDPDAVTVDFDLSTDRLEASDQLEITNNSVGAASYKWYVNYTLRSTDVEPNLTKYLTLGENVIELQAISSGGGILSLERMLSVEKKFLNAGDSLSCILSALQSGQKLTIRVRAVDEDEKTSDWSDQSQATVL